MQQNRLLSVPKKAKAILFREEKAAYTEDTAARQPSDRRDHCTGIFQREETRFPIIQGFLRACHGRNRVGGGYRIPGTCSDTRQFPPAEEAFQESSFDQAGAQK